MRTLIVSLMLGFVISTFALPRPVQVPSGQSSIQNAEAEGAAFPRQAPPISVPSGFHGGEVEGTEERKCVAFPDGAVLDHTNSQKNSRRSGEFVIGGEIIEGLKAGVMAKVFWVPLHDPASRKATLVVRSIRLDAPSITSHFESTAYAFPIKELRHPVKDSVADYEHGFYPSGFGLPSAGRWLFVATSGNDWGCFVVTVR